MSEAYPLLMPVASTSAVNVGFIMRPCSHITNLRASPIVRTRVADARDFFPHYANMARRGTQDRPVMWYLREWMDACNIKGRGAQTRMRELTGWSKATMSQLYNDDQDFSPKILREAADALNAEPYELLMHPDLAHALRRQREDSLRIVRDSGLLPTGTGE